MDRLVAIIEEVRKKITPGSDMVWTGIDDAAKFNEELGEYMLQLKSGDNRCLEKLREYFLPTSVIQEHAITNGWADEYLILSSEFDRLYDRYKK